MSRFSIILTLIFWLLSFSNLFSQNKSVFLILHEVEYEKYAEKINILLNSLDSPPLLILQQEQQLKSIEKLIDKRQFNLLTPLVNPSRYRQLQAIIPNSSVYIFEEDRPILLSKLEDLDITEVKRAAGKNSTLPLIQDSILVGQKVGWSFKLHHFKNNILLSDVMNGRILSLAINTTHVAFSREDVNPLELYIAMVGDSNGFSHFERSLSNPKSQKFISIATIAEDKLLLHYELIIVKSDLSSLVHDFIIIVDEEWGIESIIYLPLMDPFTQDHYLMPLNGVRETIKGFEINTVPNKHSYTNCYRTKVLLDTAEHTFRFNSFCIQNVIQFDPQVVLSVESTHLKQDIEFFKNYPIYILQNKPEKIYKLEYFDIYYPPDNGLMRIMLDSSTEESLSQVLIQFDASINDHIISSVLYTPQFNAYYKIRYNTILESLIEIKYIYEYQNNFSGRPILDIENNVLVMDKKRTQVYLLK